MIRVQIMPHGNWVEVPKGKTVSIENSGVLEVLGKTYTIQIPSLHQSGGTFDSIVRDTLKRFGPGTWIQYE